MTTVKVSRWGNSSAIRIPNQLLKKMNLTEGTQMEAILTPENHILLRPVEQLKTEDELKDHLKTLLSQVKNNAQRHGEVNLGIEGDELI
ncbi:AbrB/MazE/SpoVT family DNA-binding domain-containing protein [Saccharibacillus sp. JS10]|uniref:AbrB/MazE/SpoVT family DNA-binding domain-containing protein n=1 Tax=Saccharibacillus sp. JS10 TaxID=2950552 RepID=UPI00210E018E|nr:AbrB/MazE/SpoVT family DNA-binding domain-containing protein [Saccharibacillus sp. JS10]MCQ4087920.1 AbrB/MazE/SpoVT family DNA-binding domain-containing protein [Saccharibacillus sp. JS10]